MGVGRWFVSVGVVGGLVVVGGGGGWAGAFIVGWDLRFRWVVWNGRREERLCEGKCEECVLYGGVDIELVLGVVGLGVP